jgi:hypothetical protein
LAQQEGKMKSQQHYKVLGRDKGELETIWLGKESLFGLCGSV